VRKNRRKLVSFSIYWGGTDARACSDRNQPADYFLPASLTGFEENTQLAVRKLFLAFRPYLASFRHPADLFAGTTHPRSFLECSSEQWRLSLFEISNPLLPFISVIFPV
jgi:hypothetical protein